ncbi:large subunit GTPase 1 [Zygosaccharomyces mellis]|uniref:Large subunit GTPase 1 n=1 Tax=Zygosaccharomyces mellis TaxID=42258 RepID=A0A4C2E956_9SACH|nr:large subunit GTPase 1 [Zygosaccharomyces mellis]
MPPRESKKTWKAPRGPKPIPHKNKNTVGLGKAIKYARQKENDVTYLPGGEMRFTTEKHEPDWVKLRSVTQESSLNEFLNTAALADKDFSADRASNVRVIRMDNDPLVTSAFSLSNEQRSRLSSLQREHAFDLIVPRRPPWNENMTKYQLERQENDAFLEWRRRLAHLQESNEDLVLTPFERNIEVWKQLWRVVERCDLIVQIADARNPLLFRSLDLERYTKELDERKQNLLLVNKADLLTPKQRIAWSKYFRQKNISFTFFSALRANELLDLQEELNEKITHRYNDDYEEFKDLDPELLESIKILTIDELDKLFLEKAPKQPLKPPILGQPPMIQIGMVGYPNVGKSSTINSLIGAKKVSVSSTPGKTKHFQTIKLSDSVMLCDCPGLVFPNFAYQKGDLVCNGILPIDQLRDYMGPSSLVAERVPKYFVEAMYGIHIETRSSNGADKGQNYNAQELLTAYARNRGFMTQGYGSADESRASRYILKDFVNGKLLYVNPPPHLENDTPYTREECAEFNKELYSFERLPENRKEQLLEAAKSKGYDTFDLSKDLGKLTFSGHQGSDEGKEASSVTHGGKQAALYDTADELDKEFFNMNNVEGRMSTPFHKVRNDPTNSSKKHNKKNKKAKKRAAMSSA